MKLAVFFPGVGYHTDKPLLYYTKKLAYCHGYEMKEVSYAGLPSGMKGSAEKMEQAFWEALAQTEQQCAKIDFTQYEQLLFVSKSIGTAVAGAFAQRRQLTCRNIYYTPVKQSFPFMEQSGIVFSGTADDWILAEEAERGCAQNGLKLYAIPDANHSLETGNVDRDLKNLQEIMRLCSVYIAGETVT